MVSLRRPAPATIRAFLKAQTMLDFTYTAVGATASQPPAGYVVDHTRILLGQGEAIFCKARAALGRWEQFRLGWVEAWPPETPIETGAGVAVVARRLGLWWLNACRVVYVVDDSGSMARFGFAYGTLPDHAGTGEERFLVEWDRATTKSGTTSWHFRGPSTERRGQVIRTCAGFRSGSGGSRPRRCVGL